MSPSIAASIVFLTVSLTLSQTSSGAAAGVDNNTAFYLENSKCFSPTSTAAGVSSMNSNLFQNNLGLFFAKLRSRDISSTGFFNSTVGWSPTPGSGTVFGMAMCLADIPWPDQCQRCLQVASTEAPAACPSSTNANVVYQGCLLRYSDAPIFAQDFADFPLHFSTNGLDVPDTNAFDKTRKELFTALASKAVGSPLMIASGNQTFNSTHKLYGLAQCNRDLPRDLCFHFITSTIEAFPQFRAEVQWSEGFSFIAGFSFYIRYDLTPFRVYGPHTGSQPEAVTVVPHTATGPSQAETVTDVANTGTTPSQGKGGLVQRVEVIVIPVSFLIIIFLVAFIVIRNSQKKRKTRHYQSVTGLWDFPFGDIKSATKNFSKDELVGEGGFGKVYKGTFNIENNKELAVKCVTNPSAAKQLKDELRILAQLQHKNVVRLVGFCNNDGWFRRGRGLYVCNEYISNDSLDKHIVGASLGQSILKWRIRCQIIRGICTGLKYLHHDCNRNILHMDLKPSNILLDDEMTPKIADFGLSRAFLNNKKTHTYTKEVKGSNGYIAPEFFERGRVGRPCDIYSLGVLILAIVMGQGPTGLRDPGGVRFIDKVRKNFIIDLESTNPNTCSAVDREQLKKDATLKVDDNIEDVEKCVGLAFECVNEEPTNRPTAKDICTRINQVIPEE